MIFDDKVVLVTGGTGSFGSTMVRVILERSKPKKVIIFSRDELKQYEMGKKFSHPSIRFFIGDVRDRERLYRAFDGVNIIIHAAAQKQVPAAEYNPFEAIKTNIIGAANVIEAAIDRHVTKVIALSSDKAANPINLYGATKLCADKLFIAGNAYTTQERACFSVVRYGNVVGSRGSVVQLFKEKSKTGVVPITDVRMTRFWITLPQAVEFVIQSLEKMQGGEIFVPKLPSMKIIDLAEVIAPQSRKEIIGIRPGEKLHELMFGEDDSRYTVDMGDFFVVKPMVPFWKNDPYPSSTPLPDRFVYSSETNSHWISSTQMKALIKNLEIL